MTARRSVAGSEIRRFAPEVIPVIGEDLGQLRRAAVDDDVFCVRRLGGGGQVETPVLHGLAINDDDLVVYGKTLPVPRFVGLLQ